MNYTQFLLQTKIKTIKTFNIRAVILATKTDVAIFWLLYRMQTKYQGIQEDINADRTNSFFNKLWSNLELCL